MKIISDMINGVIGGIVCAILCYIFTSICNIRAKKELKNAVEKLNIYLISICNDTIWGTEDLKPEYYDSIISKVDFAFYYLDKARSSIKLMNFLFCHRKYILLQLDEIEKALKHHLTLALSDSPEQEKLARLTELKEKYLVYNQSILVYRAGYILELLKRKSLRKAVDDITYEEEAEKTDRLFAELTKL